MSQPVTHDVRCHLRTVVRAHMRGDAMCQHGVGQCLDDVHTVQASPYLDGQTLARELVDDSVVHEV
eukprot:243-Eustigmatos_ZCMA.PRE.1